MLTRPFVVILIFFHLLYYPLGTTAINSLFIGQITAILVATPEFQNGTWTFAHITSNLALITGIICLVVGFLHLGLLFDFICQPAIAGFMGGTAVTIITSQVHKLKKMEMSKKKKKTQVNSKFYLFLF